MCMQVCMYMCAKVYVCVCHECVYNHDGAKNIMS